MAKSVAVMSNRRPALPHAVCMVFDDETLNACGEKAKEIYRIEIPLGSLTAVQMIEIVRIRAESMPKISKKGYVINKHWRRTEVAAAHPSEGGCFIVIELYLCPKHTTDMS